MKQVDVRSLLRLLGDPGAAESLSAVAGGAGAVIVNLKNWADIRRVADATGFLQTLPCVLVAIVDNSCPIDDFPTVAAAFDIVLSSAADAGSIVKPPIGLDAAISSIDSRVTVAPIAATGIAMLLRSRCESFDVPPSRVYAALAGESALYSALQGGAEFNAWRSRRPHRADDDRSSRVRVEREGDLLHITLSRPAKRNAIDTLMRDQLIEAFRIAAADRDLQVLIDADGPDFCSGGDLDEFGSRPDTATAHLIRMSRSLPWAIELVRARTEARLQGACYGAGIELPAFASRIIVSPDARFGLPELSLGLVPGAGGTVSIARRIGRHRTAYLALTGEAINAHTALAWGLVDAIR